MAGSDDSGSGGKPAQGLGLWSNAMRAPFFTASIVPVLLGGSVAYFEAGVFDPLNFILTALGVVSLHAGGNMFNDYFDYKSGADILNESPTPFSGGSRVLVDGLLKPGTILAASIIATVLGLALGGFLALRLGPVIVVLGLLGVICGLAYSAPPFKLAYRGLGEVVVALVFGPLITTGSYYAQTGSLTHAPVIASLPIAILIAAALYINEFPDYEADKKAGKNQIVVQLGLRRAVNGYGLLLSTTYVIILLGVVSGDMPLLALLGLLTIPQAMKAYGLLKKHHKDIPNLLPANALTIKIHLQTGLLLSLGYIASALY
ncbi:MAG: prenyltransferase [Candidatus Hydrothermarchaeales archaeon]